MNITIKKTTACPALPDIIANCTGTVFLVMDNGQPYPINTHHGVLKIFRKLWNCSDLEEVNLCLEKHKRLPLFFKFHNNCPEGFEMNILAQTNGILTTLFLFITYQLNGRKKYFSVIYASAHPLWIIYDAL